MPPAVGYPAAGTARPAAGRGRSRCVFGLGSLRLHERPGAGGRWRRSHVSSVSLCTKKGESMVASDVSATAQLSFTLEIKDDSRALVSFDQPKTRATTVYQGVLKDMA